MPHPTTPFLLLLAFVALLALATLLVSLYTLHKVRRVHLKLFDLAQDSVKRLVLHRVVHRADDLEP